MRSRSGGLGNGGMDVTADHEGDGVAGGESVQVDGELAQVLGVVAELDTTAAQSGIDAVAIPKQIDAGGAVDAAQLGPAAGLL